MNPDAIIILSAGIKQEADGRWVSTDLTVKDDAQGAPGGVLRVRAALVLANRYPHAAIVTTGSNRGLDMPKDAPKDRPFVAQIMSDELTERGTPRERIILEERSGTTYQGLQELEQLAHSNNWGNVVIITNRYHVPRVHAMLQTRFPTLLGNVEIASAEDILIAHNAADWESFITEAYASDFMAARMEKEEQGVAQIRDGTYRYR